MRQTARALVIEGNKILLMKRNKFGHEYYALLGGAIEADEKPAETVIREVKEEASIDISEPRLVIIEDAGEVFGVQYIFLCKYLSGEPMLSPDSPEAKINAMGKNLYEPVWVSIDDLKTIRMLPKELQDLIVKFYEEGFPDQPVDLKIENVLNQ